MQDAPMPQGQGQSGIPPGSDNPLTNMIVQTDQALSQIAQVIAKASPEAGQALMQIEEQYRAIISSVMSQGHGQQKPPSQMVSPETHGKQATQAY